MEMKFNGEIWRRIAVAKQKEDEPDEFVIVKNPKYTGGLIPYVRYGKVWTTTVQNRILIRELMNELTRLEAAAETGF